MNKNKKNPFINNIIKILINNNSKKLIKKKKKSKLKSKKKNNEYSMGGSLGGNEIPSRIISNQINPDLISSLLKIMNNKDKNIENIDTTHKKAQEYLKSGDIQKFIEIYPEAKTEVNKIIYERELIKQNYKEIQNDIFNSKQEANELYEQNLITKEELNNLNEKLNNLNEKYQKGKLKIVDFKNKLTDIKKIESNIIDNIKTSDELETYFKNQGLEEEYKKNIDDILPNYEKGKIAFKTLQEKNKTLGFGDSKNRKYIQKNMASYDASQILKNDKILPKYEIDEDLFEEPDSFNL